MSSEAAARADIQRAEAARVLGVLTADGLPARAGRWLSAGMDTENVRALAQLQGIDDVSDGVRLALVAEIATELGLAFATVQQARSVHAQEIIRTMSTGANVSPQIFDLSNGVTDELTTRVRRFFGRLRHGD